MTCESVAGTARYNAKGSAAVDDRARYLIDGAVASDCNYDIYTRILCFSGNLGSMSGIFRKSDFYIKNRLVDISFDERWHGVFVCRA